MFSKRSDDGSKPRQDDHSSLPATMEQPAKASQAPRRAPPPPPRPGAAGSKLARPAGPKIKPRPLDALNVDLSNSKAPPRSVVEGTADAVLRKSTSNLPEAEPVEFETPMVREEDDIDMRDIARRKATELENGVTLEIEDKREGGFGANKGRGKAKLKDEGPAQPLTRGDQGREGMHNQAYYELKSEIFEALIDAMDMGRVVSLPREDAENEISQIVNEIIAVKGHIMSIAEQKRLVEDICDDVLGYGPLEPLLERDDIADIMVNGAEQVYIEVDGKIELTNIRFRDNQQLLEICQRMVSKVGRRVDESSPICDARLLDGSRVNVIAPPLAIDGATLTIRKFKKDKLKLSDLIKFGALTDEAAVVLQIAAACRCNILISGGTGSGKTTLLNCLSGFAGDDERIITCEDSAELQLQQPHVVRLETRPANLEGKGEVSMRDLVKNCLRMRPERIIVGEVRGPEAFDLLQAMNTGHDGSMGTLHANSPREGLSRLESMITMGGFALPSKTIREMIVSAVNVVVQAQRLRDGSRRITHISEVLGMEGDTVITQDLVKYKVTGEDEKGKLIGRHVSTGIGQPAFWERARGFNRDVELQDALASMEEVVD
jgi:pilus assembly protein CpaF